MTSSFAKKIYLSIYLCVQMSRNVVVSFAEGYSEVLDDKKIGAIRFFASDWGGGGAIFGQGVYSSGGYTWAFTVREREGRELRL